MGFGDLETSLVEICNCTQRAEEHFRTSVVLRVLKKWMNLTFASIQKEQNLVKDLQGCE